MPAGRSPALIGRPRSGGRSWSRTPRKPPAPPPTREQNPLPAGAEVEVRVDHDGFHGSWFEATVVDFAPARGRRSRASYKVAYSHLLAEDDDTLVEPFAPSHIRPRPPPPPGPGSSPRRFLLHDIVEVFDRGGWWSGIVVEAADPAASVSVAFPITREVIAFAPHLVRPRRDYVDGKWLPSRVVIGVQPKRAVRVYEVGDNVDVVKKRKVYGYSWFSATVVKVVDPLSYILEYSDHDEGARGAEKLTEYLDWQFIRPAVEHSPAESEYQLGPGAAVEAYCDGAWSPGVVRRVVGEGEYEVSVGEKTKLLVTKVVELLKPQYKWDGNRWSIVKPKVIQQFHFIAVLASFAFTLFAAVRQANLRQQSASGKRPSSPVEVAFGDDGHSHDPEYSGTKKSRKELLQQEIVSAEGSEHASVTEMDIPLSALCNSSAINHSPNCCSPLSGHSTLPIEPIPNVGETVINQQIQSVMVPPENNEGKSHLIETLQGGNDASDNVQILLKENSNMSSKTINCALSGSSESQTTSALTRWVSTGTNSGSNMKVYIRKSAIKKGFEGLRSPQSSLDATSTVQQRGRKKAAGRMIQPSLVLENSKSQTQQQLDRTLEDTPNINEVINQELLPTVHRSFESMYDGKGIDIHSSVLDEQLTAINSICHANTGIAATQVAKSNRLTETPTLSLDRLVQQDGGNVDESAILLRLQNAGSSLCITENNLFRRCSVAGSSMPSDFAFSQISGHQVLFVKSSPAWPLIEAMDVFKEAPQQPHFLPLREFLPDLREGMAIGLMVSFANVVRTTRESSIEDSVKSFEEKIDTLCHLEKNGFNVQSLQHYLIKLFEIKSGNTKHLKEKDDLKAKMLEKTTSLSQIDSLLDEIDNMMKAESTAIAEHEKKLGQLRLKAQQIAKKKEHEDAELSRLKAADSSVKEACGDDERQFRSILAELQRKHLT
ncbi:uncharacterized protein LOC133901083 [Phragmites australis]|uniref:uncharacterized protein LOC133901083 n=1 Tax=Phragmites australis TaxID=29695 RepID=UPI002D7A2570|nr:uncharacterized protein LOC133901083 [Phragmites australis]